MRPQLGSFSSKLRANIHIRMGPAVQYNNYSKKLFLELKVKLEAVGHQKLTKTNPNIIISNYVVMRPGNLATIYPAFEETLP